jgi:hypothetical protein
MKSGCKFSVPFEAFSEQFGASSITPESFLSQRPMQLAVASLLPEQQS